MMLKKVTFIILVTFIGLNVFAQSFGISTSYQYLNAFQWNKAIQTYNFSRPHLTEKQPLFTYGYNVGAYFLFSSEKKLTIGPSLFFSSYTSSSQNENLNVQLNVSVLDIGLIMRCRWGGPSGAFYTDLITSATGINLSKKMNDEAFKVDGSILSAPGIGLGLNLRTGCNFFLKNKFSIYPFVGVGLDPFIWAPDAESLLNQTYDMATDPFTIIFRYQLGMAINFNNNSRDER